MNIYSSKFQHQRQIAKVNPSVPVLQIYFEEIMDTKTDFRLSRDAISMLVRLLGIKKRHGWNPVVEVLVFLYWLGHGASYSVVSRVFSIPKTSVFRIVHSIALKVVALRTKCIQFPKPHKVGEGFAKLAHSHFFKKCVGAIDGCHVRIKKPVGPDAQDYFNRKLFYSVQLQAICDSNGIFLDTFVGYPGSVHDTRVLKNSPVYTEALYPPAGYFILGDGGYPCIEHPICIITPFKEPVRDAIEGRFNAHVSKARCVIERAFGMMKTRWCSIFFKALEVDSHFVPDIITSCTVLHNICLGVGDVEDPEPAENDVGPFPQMGPGDLSGAALRNTLARQISAPRTQLHDHNYL